MITGILDILSMLLRVLSFLIGGFALGRFTLDAYRKAEWQVQVALVVGFFLLVIGIVDFAPIGPASAFVLGAGIAFLREYWHNEDKREEENHGS
jgi:hypothetical protein